MSNVTRADRRRHARSVAKIVTTSPLRDTAPQSFKCAACGRTCTRTRFSTHVMQAMLWHPIAPDGWKYTCPGCGWIGHIVEGLHPMDDAWIKAQEAIAGGDAVRVTLRVVAESISGIEASLFEIPLGGTERPSGLVIAR